MKLFTYNGTEPIEPQVFTPDDFESYLGDEKLVGKGGELYKLIHKSKSPLVSDEECQVSMVPIRSFTLTLAQTPTVSTRCHVYTFL
jgi:hypothetical protein